MDYSHLLRDADVKALRAVLGHPVVELYARTVDVRQHVVIAPHFSLDLGGGGHYCVAESDWNDTPQAYLDYHMIAVTLQDWPKGVARARPDVGETATGRWRPAGDALGHPSVVHPQRGHGVIDHIKILEHRAASDSESVHYDHALVLIAGDPEPGGGVAAADDHVRSCRESFGAEAVRLDLAPARLLLARLRLDNPRRARRSAAGVMTDFAARRALRLAGDVPALGGGGIDDELVAGRGTVHRRSSRTLYSRQSAGAVSILDHAPAE